MDTDAKSVISSMNVNKLLYSSFITTNLDANSLENIILVNFMEDEIIRVANEFKYDAIITVNTNKLTQVCIIILFQKLKHKTNEFIFINEGYCCKIQRIQN